MNIDGATGVVYAELGFPPPLCRGLFEELPLEFWLLYTLPFGANRSKEEIRLRTLVGALESMRCGITTVQDMSVFSPVNEEVLDTILDAYAEAGIRVVYSITVRDKSQLDTIPWIAELAPADLHSIIGTHSDSAGPQMDFVEKAIARVGDRGGMLRWALAPSAPTIEPTAGPHGKSGHSTSRVISAVTRTAAGSKVMRPPGGRSSARSRG